MYCPSELNTQLDDEVLVADEDAAHRLAGTSEAQHPGRQLPQLPEAEQRLLDVEPDEPLLDAGRGPIPRLVTSDDFDGSSDVELPAREERPQRRTQPALDAWEPSAQPLQLDRQPQQRADDGLQERGGDAERERHPGSLAPRREARRRSELRTDAESC